MSLIVGVAMITVDLDAVDLTAIEIVSLFAVDRVAVGLIGLFNVDRARYRNDIPSLHYVSLKEKYRDCYA